MHPHYRSNAPDDSLAQQVEHIPFKDGVLGSSPRRITETTIKIKQIPDNQTLSGISFLWQVAENSRFKHIVGVQIVVHKSDHPEKLWGKKKIVVLLYGNRLRTIITRRSTDLF